MRYRVPLLLCALLVCSLVFGAFPVAGQPAPGETHLEVQLQDNGDAEWSVTVAVPITDEADREDFEAFATAFEEGESDIELGVNAFERAADEAATESGREMEIHSIRRESEILNETDGEGTASRGLLRVEFTWESFGRVGENGTLYVDDAFNTSDGTWLPGLTAEQSLTIRAPPGYGGPTTSPIGADAGDLHWEGPQTFGPGYFTIVYPPSSTGPVDPGGDLSTTLVGGALLLSAAALFVGVYLLVSRRRSENGATDGQPAAEESTETPPSEPATDVEAGTEETGGVETDQGSATPAGETEELELLSDEERVERLLEENGGRMKQATIVKETGWSNAKVSQLLSAMDEAGRINKLRIGRENLISLPGEGVGDIDHESDGE
jgi:hypothetical protein